MSIEKEVTKDNFNAEDIDDWWQPITKIPEGATIGIDFGTTNSCIAYWDESQSTAEVIEFNDCPTIPSVVAFQSFDQIKVGYDALEYQQIFPSVCIDHIKRLIGHRYDEDEVQEFMNTHNFKLNCLDYIQQPTPNIQIEISENNQIKYFDIDYICICILSYLKNSAEIYLKKKVTNCVLTVPAYFSTYQREILLKAATDSGLNVLRLIGEPTASALCYGLGVAGNKNIIICDFGGGTFDVSIMNINEGKFKILGINGNNHLGGHDIDIILYNYILRKFCKVDHLSTKESVAVMREVERIKCLISTEDEVFIEESILDIINSYSKTKYNSVSITRTQFNALVQCIINKCIYTINQAMELINIQKEDIQEIVLVGGSSRLLCFQEAVSTFFNNKELCQSINPKTCVAKGAAIQAAALCVIDKELLRHVLMLDALPMSIGIKTNETEFSVILPRNILLPAKRTEYFRTQEDNQEYLCVEVYEGEHTKVKDNKFLGVYDIPITNYKKKAGEEEIGISLEVTVDGVLKLISDHFVEQDDRQQKKAYMLLWLYILLLFILFIFVKLFFEDEKSIITSEL